MYMKTKHLNPTLIITCFVMIAFMAVITVFALAYHDKREISAEDIDSFSFSLVWDCYGISSYDSLSGKLVKTNVATHPEDYITEYTLTEEEKKRIYMLISELDILTYPNEYNPHNNGLVSEPSMDLILSVSIDGMEKTVKAKDIALSYDADNPKGQKFLNVCKEIKDLLTATDEWKSLPDYEVLFH